MKRLSLSMYFFLLGFIYAAWIVRLPDLQVATGVSDAGLGIALFFAALGAFSAIFVSALVIRKLSSAETVLLMCGAYALVLPCMAFAHSGLQLSIILFFAGSASAILDVAINTQAVVVERQSAKPIMSSLHAMYSVGATSGGGLAVILMRYNTEWHFSIISLLSLIIILIFARGLDRTPVVDSGHATKGRFLPSPILKALAVVMFCSLLVEGALAEWSTKFMKEVAGAPPELLPYALSGFSLGMLLGRALGDLLRRKVQDTWVVIYGSLVSVLATATLLLVINVWVSVAAFTLAGFGLSILIPVCFSVAGKSGDSNPEVAIAQLTSIGYSGFMIGPPVIGFLSYRFGLVNGLLIVPLLMSVSLLVTLRVLKKKA